MPESGARSVVQPLSCYPSLLTPSHAAPADDKQRSKRAIMGEATGRIELTRALNRGRPEGSVKSSKWLPVTSIPFGRVLCTGASSSPKKCTEAVVMKSTVGFTAG